MRNRSARCLLLVAVLLTVIAVAVPTVDACARCALGMCIDAAADGAASCRQVIYFYGGIIVTGCELTGTCSWGSGEDSDPCQPCEPAIQPL